MPYTKNKTKHILERRLNQEVSKKDKVNIKTSKKKNELKELIKFCQIYSRNKTKIVSEVKKKRRYNWRFLKNHMCMLLKLYIKKFYISEDNKHRNKMGGFSRKICYPH